MGRIYNNINIHGRDSRTLFDSGARNTYVTSDVAKMLMTDEPDEPIRSALGGSVREITQTAVLNGKLEGHQISTHALVVDRIGNDDNGNPIDILFGALAMQQWGIRLIPEHEKLDMTHYPDEFVEF